MVVGFTVIKSFTVSIFVYLLSIVIQSVEDSAVSEWWRMSLFTGDISQEMPGEPDDHLRLV
jgi:hypothetical protein